MGPRRYVPNLGPATIVASGLTVPVLTTSVADYNEVYDALAGLHRKFPVRSLRRLKEHVYRLVLEKEPVATLYTQDLEADTDVAKIEVAIGVGAVDRIHQRGYRAINRLDLVDDILNDDGTSTLGQLYVMPSPNFSSRRLTCHSISTCELPATSPRMVVCGVRRSLTIG